MAFTLKIKSSSVAGKVPDASALKTAELGLNLVDQKLYSKDANGTVFEIGQAGDTPSGPTPPTDGNQLGDLFFDTFENILLYWNGVEWVPVGNEAIAIGDLTDVAIGDQALTNGQILIYNGSEWVNADLDIPPGTVVSEIAPANPEQGQLWWSTATIDNGGNRLYVWTGSQWADATQPGDGSGGGSDEYLSKVSDDTAAGKITFNDLAYFKLGAEVQGGTLSGVNEASCTFSPTITSATGDFANYKAFLSSNITANTVTGYLAGASLATNVDPGERAYGFRAELNLDSGEPNYGFYSSGTAYNYLSGWTAIGSGHGAHPEPDAVLHVKSEWPNVLKLERENNANATIEFDNSNNQPIFMGLSPDNDFAIHTIQDTAQPGALIRARRDNAKVELGNPSVTSSVEHSLMVKGRFGCDSIRPYSSGSANVVVNADGLLQMAGSSLRFKTGVETMQDAYADKIVDECRPVFYRPNPAVADPDEEFDPTKSYWGFIAEEVEQVDPRLVWYGKDEDGNDRVDGVAYDSFAPILLNVVKRQKDHIAGLEARIEKLEAAAGGTKATTTRKRKS